MALGAAGVRAFLEAEAAAGTITLLGASESAFDVIVPSYWKETVTCSIVVHDHGVRAEAFFLRAPEENPEAFYRLLLQRNDRSFVWRFAANEAGDTSLVAELPADAVTEETLDRLLGTLVTLTDETYVPAMRSGWEKGLEAQVAMGLPGVDRPPPWAGKPPPGARPAQPPPAPS